MLHKSPSAQIEAVVATLLLTRLIFESVDGAAPLRCGEEGGAAAMSGSVASIVGRAEAGGNPAPSEGAEAATGHRRAARRSQEARRAVRAKVGSETFGIGTLV